MHLYSTASHSDEEGTAEAAKSALVFASKEELIKICTFFDEVKRHLENSTDCHMHLRDFYEDWLEDKDFDLEITLLND
jgi:hypothetical protein